MLKIIDLEKKSVFFINSFFIVLMIVFFLYDVGMSYFFYSLIITTFILSYFFFKRSRKLSKYIIVTNLFIFFYFLSPMVSQFLYNLFGTKSYLFVLFYNLVIAYLFLLFSGFKDSLYKNLEKTNWKIIGLVVLIGIFFGFLFFFVKEPIPAILSNPYEINYYPKVIFFTIILAISEQMIFSGFLFNTYKKLTNKKEAMFQVATLFFLFHMLRFSSLIETFIYYFGSWYILMVILYYLFLFIFMLFCIYLYDFTSSKKHKLKWHGNFLYPVLLHFVTDLVLFIFVGLTL